MVSPSPEYGAYPESKELKVGEWPAEGPKEGEFRNGPGPEPEADGWPDNVEPKPDTAPEGYDKDANYGAPFQVGNPGQPAGPKGIPGTDSTK